MAAGDELKRLKAQLDLEEQIAEAIKNSTSSLDNFAESQKKITENYKLIRKISQEIAILEEEIKKANADEKKLLSAQLDSLKQQQKVLFGVNKELSKAKNFAKAIGSELLSGAKILKNQFIPTLNDIFQKFLSIDDLAHQTANTLGFQGTKFKFMQDNISASQEAFISMGGSMEDAYKVQTALSDATGRQVMLTKDASTAIAQTAKITGMAAEEMGTLVGQMEAFGLGAQDSSKMILEMSQEAAQMGLNSGKVIKKFQENLGLLNKLNFKNGIKGLKEMAKFSEKYKIDMNDVAAVADKVFRPEGAIEAAAQLQVLGGALATLGDPFQLMYKARNAPEELAKSITKAATASAVFNKQTGEFEVNAYELDRMKEAAAALGMDYTKLVETAKQGAKLKQFSGILSGKGLDKDTMDALTGAAQMGKEGAFITIKGDKKYLKDLTSSEIELFKKQSAKQDELAENAKSIQNNFDQIKNELMASFVKVFQDIDWNSLLTSLKWAANAITGSIKWLQDLFGSKGLLLSGLALYFGGKAALQWGVNAAGGLLKGLGSSAIKGGKGLLSTITGNKGNPEIPTKEFKPRSYGNGKMGADKGESGVGSLTKGINTTDMIKGAAAILILSAALFVFAKSLQEFEKLKNGWETLGMAATGLLVLTGALFIISKIPTESVIKGGLAIALLGASMIPLAFGLNMMNDVGIGTIGVLAAGLLVLGAAGFLMGLVAPEILLGALAIGALGIAVIPLAYAFTLVAEGIATIVTSFTNMFAVIGPNGSSLLLAGVGFMSMAAGVGILAVSLIALGASSLLALPGLLILSNVTSMLTETASALQATGGSEGITKTINAINSVDVDKLEALKSLSTWMALLGGTTTVKFDESLHVDGSIQLAGQAGGKTNTDWIKDPIFVDQLKKVISDSEHHQRNGGK